ncbi:DUF6232 family protein [Micromonospora craniellae]|uniref:Uncharacterized protein n=1 Tax=Micromonospora craniellae TaxID=2294034 RepID=A0A372FW12_9ACTN|nr:DUF6232 family protein [Micromonospora craniellae]QOC93175.1 hypothetical protein ID554_05635 [Micromonospora craniellae]RFS44824.1 hypothetical protein D0Q02_20280 [Micromonospora craniellae]
MALYYRDDTVQVTSESIRAGGHVIPMPEVTYVWHAKGQTTLAVRGRVLGRGVLVLLLSLPPLVGLVCVISLAWSASDRGEWMPALIVFAACVVIALALVPFLEIPLGWLDRSYERGNRVNELWVQYRGQEVMVLRTPDALRFGQIYRAVQRAVEQQGDHW